ncbi:hypothetical protein AFLA_004836 [Aspergillus flavus NRRL3357]|nr:hypothetical protein AFLA_004836 [Aspergillus flavus NRRL3357]
MTRHPCGFCRLCGADRATLVKARSVKLVVGGPGKSIPSLFALRTHIRGQRDAIGIDLGLEQYGKWKAPILSHSLDLLNESQIVT